jgi:hypothetical protein
VKTYALSGMRVNPNMLELVFEREDMIREGRVSNERLRRVSDYNITLSRIGQDGCRCRVIPGMTVDQLLRMGGCKEGYSDPETFLDRMGYVCPRLSQLRRLYGH